MQEGSLRCDVNVSVRQEGQKEFGVRSECKNVNSFSGAVRAIDYESARQIGILESGGTVEQETRRWDDMAGKSFLLRSKEEAHDYRYFPEPDLMPMEISREWVEEIRNALPELPHEKKARFMNEYKLPEYDAGLISVSDGFSRLIDETVSCGAAPKEAANWILGEISKEINERGITSDDVPFGGKILAELISLINKGTISGSIAKQIVPEMFDSDKTPEEIVKDKALLQISDPEEIAKIIRGVFAENPKAIEDYKGGKTNVRGFLTGQVMRATKGKANPAIINKQLEIELGKL